jgi:hypothetical protein
MTIATIPTIPATAAAFKHNCQDLGLCQWRDPACDTCPNKTAPLAAPTWAQVFRSWLPSRDACWGTALFVALFATYAWTQNADDAAATAELAKAQQLGYYKGYNTGSAAALKAAHTACEAKLSINPSTCDWLLTNAVVAYADEVQP